MFLSGKMRLFRDYVTETFLGGMRLICYGLEYSQVIAVAHITDFNASSSVITQHPR
jgi:hypothetical protein